MAGTNVTSINDLLPQIVAEAMFVASETSIMRNLVRTFDIPAASGNSIVVPRYPTVSAATYTGSADTEIANSTVSTDGVTIDIGTVALRTMVSDQARYSAASNVVADIGRLFGEAVSRKMDQDLCNLFSGFGTSIGSTSTAVSAATIFQAVASLRSNAVPGTELACVLHPAIAYDLKANLTNTFANPNAGILQNEAMMTGYVGMLAGVPVYETSNITTVLGAPGMYVGGLFHRNALGLAMSGGINIESQRRASFLGDDIVGSANYGVGELYDTYGVRILGDASQVS
jgi:N4-gp56 family major capsid protein